jgi:predicted ATP-dependent endonuclease of OLD family
LVLQPVQQKVWGLNMKINTVQIHNFRSVLDGALTLCDYSLLIGPNNSGKTNVIDALRVFYEHNGEKYVFDRDIPK